MIKISDYVANFLEEKKIKVVFGVIGSANAHLFDSIENKGYTRIVYVHHEQAAVMAAGAYYRTCGELSVALVTAGPGAANAITGVISNWADSIPCIILSGQESTFYIKEHKHLRMIGTQGFNAAKMLKDVTKYSVIASKDSIVYEMQKTHHLCQQGRPGPVWIEIPFDTQSSMIDIKKQKKYDVKIAKDKFDLSELETLLRDCERPVILGGHGIRLSNSKESFRKLINKYQVPTLLTWSGIDLLPNNNKYYFGRSGIYGQRCANFVVQNCDLLIVLGSRLALPQTGYNIDNYAPKAKIVMVNNDKNELEKYSRYDVKIKANVKDVIDEMLKIDPPKCKEWLEQCNHYSDKFPAVEKHHKIDNGYLNSYVFMNDISKYLKNDHVIVVGMGTAMVSSHQAIELKEGQTMFTSNGLGEMGWGLPSLVGAAMASPEKPMLCLMSDGSMMMNLQELQTILNYNINAKIVIFNNDGYLFIKHTQKMLFNGKFVGVNKDTGIILPKYDKIATAFGYRYLSNINNSLEEFFAEEGPCFYEVFMHPEQPLTPKVKGIATKDGIVAPPIEEMSPLLNIEEVNDNMIIGTNELSEKIRALK